MLTRLLQFIYYIFQQYFTFNNKELTISKSDNVNVDRSLSTTPLSLYLQKYIISMISNHINYFNKKSTTTLEIYYFREDKKEINRLLLNVSLVSKYWFGCISNSIYTIIGYQQFNSLKGSNSQYSIIKYNNIKYIIEICEYYGMNSTERRYKGIHYNFNSSSFKTKQLKSVTITRDNFINERITNRNWFFLTNIKHNRKSALKVNLLQFEFKNFLIPFDIFKLKVNKIYSIVISNYINDLNLLEQILQHYSNSIKQMVFDANLSDFSNKLNTISTNNYLNNIQSINIQSSNLTFNDLKLILHSTNNLKELYINICFHKLIYYFSKKNNSGGGDCGIKDCNGLLSIYENDDEFYNYWLELINNLNLKGTIKHLSIGDSCKNKTKTTRMVSNASNEFFNEIALLVSSIKSLVMFTLKNAIMPEIFDLIVNKFKNTTINSFHMISYYHFVYFQGTIFNKSISLFNSISSKSHITNLKITNYNNLERSTYKVQNIYNFNKFEN